MQTALSSLPLTKTSNMNMAGDYNCTKNGALDRRTTSSTSLQYSNSLALENLCQVLKLQDNLHTTIRNAEMEYFQNKYRTFKRKTGSSRLDRFYVSESLVPRITHQGV